MTERTWPLLAVASVVLLTAGGRFINNGLDELAASFFGVGFLLTGVWVAVEVRVGESRRRRYEALPPDEDSDGA